MKVLCMIDSLTAGGAQRQLVNLAVLLKKNGADIEFVVYRKNSFFQPILEQAEIKITYLSNKNYLDRLISARKFIKSVEPDYVISFLETPNFMACFSSIGRHKWKLITTELSAKDSTFCGIKSKVFLFFQIFSDAIVCNSENAAEKWRINCPGFSNKIRVIYNPVILENMDNRKCLHSGKRKNIVIPASYQYLKNPVRLIEALHRIDRQRLSELHLDWYGNPEPDFNNTRAYDESCGLIKKYNLNDVITLNHQTDQIYSIMRDADAVALFSTVEGLPNAICEGMMLKKPIIMSKVSDYKVFEKTGGFILCDPLCVDSIANAINQFLDLDSNVCTKMGQNNYEFAINNFAPEIIVKKWIELFDEIEN